MSNLNTALLAAIDDSNLDSVEELLQKGANPNFPGEAKNRTPIHRAILLDSPQMLRLLVKHGAAINAGEPGGDSYLMYAVVTGQANAAKALLKMGVDVSREELKEALSWPTISNRPKLIEALIDAGFDLKEEAFPNDTLGFILEMECLPALRALIKRGLNVKQTLDDGTPLLLEAVFGGYPRTRVFKLLLSAGADPNGTNAKGETALMWAAASGKKNLVRALLDSGADPGMLDVSGRSAAIWAAEWGLSNLVSELSALSGEDLNTPREIDQCNTLVDDFGTGEFAMLQHDKTLEGKKSRFLCLSFAAPLQNISDHIYQGSMSRERHGPFIIIKKLYDTLDERICGPNPLASPSKKRAIAPEKLLVLAQAPTRVLNPRLALSKDNLGVRFAVVDILSEKEVVRGCELAKSQPGRAILVEISKICFTSEGWVDSSQKALI